MLGFIIWAIVGLCIVGIGISAFFSKKAVGFWANIEVEKVNDIKKYNASVGKLFLAYGLIFILLGTPMLSSNTALILFSVLGVMIETIAVMIVYTQGISKKYRAK